MLVFLSIILGQRPLLRRKSAAAIPTGPAPTISILFFMYQQNDEIILLLYIFFIQFSALIQSHRPKPNFYIILFKYSAMKLLLLVCALLSLVITTQFTIQESSIELAYDLSKNYVLNNDFGGNSQAKGYTILNSSNPWTEVKNQMEIGDGPIYNRNWPSGNVCELDANENSKIKQINLGQPNKYQLSFDYAAREGHAFDTSRLSVWFNEEKIAEYTPQDYEIHHTSLIVNGLKGENILELRGEGPSDSYGATIRNISLYAQLKKRPSTLKISEWKQNYILNGDFEDPALNGGWRFISPSAWVGVPQMEVGDGKIYNSQWSTGQICELDGSANDVVIQTVVFDSVKTCSLEFDWAARQGTSLDSCLGSAWVNGFKLSDITPINYKVDHFKHQVKTIVGSNTVLLKGQGVSDGYGLTIDNVQLNCPP